MTTDERLAKVAEVLRRAARDHLGLVEGDYWPSGVAEAQATGLAPLLDEFAAQDRAATIEAVEAACRLAAPDHLTPMGERIILAAVRAEAHDARATAPLSDAQPERGAAGHRDGTGAQNGGEGS